MDSPEVAVMLRSAKHLKVCPLSGLLWLQHTLYTPILLQVLTICRLQLLTTS
jgi:hypothetical protein